MKKQYKATIDFVKMQGLGNDYIYIDCFRERPQAVRELAVILSDRHFGVGGDGIVLIMPPTKGIAADARMRMFNLDGSEGAMCGNAIRCVAKYLFDNRIVTSEHMQIETASGIKRIKVFANEGFADIIEVDMGEAQLIPYKIPALVENLDRIVDYPIFVLGREYMVTCVSVGNPHCVIFQNGVDELDLGRIGPHFENHPLFPNRINTEFVEIIDQNTLKMRVYERGSGETLACGTGACASVCAAVLCGHCKEGEDVRVILRGGELVINYTKNSILMRGAAKKVFEGRIEVCI